MKSIFTLLLSMLLSPGWSYSQTFPGCLGERQQLTVSSNMPYIIVKIGNSQGYFVMDWGTLSSAIDTAGVVGPRVRSSGVDGNGKFLFDNFDFYGSWGTVTLDIQKMGHITGSVRQAGLLGADFLTLNIFTLDYNAGFVYRADSGQLCDDKILGANGFRAVSSAGYYANRNSKLNDASVFNIPTVPIRIGSITALAQLDPGYSDDKYPFSVNINRALFDALITAGIKLVEIPNQRVTLTTCKNNVTESVVPYRMPLGTAFSIIGVDGLPVTIHSDAVLMLKETPDAAKSCGGIGTWKIPAAQVGASYFKEAGKMIFDPFTSRIWFGNGR